jgi:hypothetical protein
LQEKENETGTKEACENVAGGQTMTEGFLGSGEVNNEEHVRNKYRS